MTRLERRYRRLLRAYPRAYREEHGEELVATLMEASGPFWREAGGLIRGGLVARARARTAHPVARWADGLHLGVLGIVLTKLVSDLSVGHPGVMPQSLTWIALGVGLLITVLRGWIWPALPLAVGYALWLTTMPDFQAGPVLEDFVFNASSWLVVAMLAALAVRRPRGLCARSWGWLTVPAVVLTAQHLAGFYAFSGNGTKGWALLECLALVVGIAATAAARDARWLLAAGIYLLPGLVDILYRPPYDTMHIVYRGVLATLLLTMAAVVYRTRALSRA